MHTITRTNKKYKYVALALFALLIFTLSGCVNSDDLDYDDFNVYHLSSWEHALDRDEEQYLLYYYGVNCSHCTDLKPDILGFADSNNAELVVYFIESGNVSLDNYNAFPVYDPITGLAIPGTPTIMVIKNGKVVAMEVGPTIIKDLLKQIEEGSYGLID
ncbi:Thioredoxin [Candidatus Izimaplasma bacterium HR1]|jgi:predicted bacteriocin transport accessory protein|uniref:thioredoxin family protein n=1 Tax=Candidatus Izimoplasma sp. HR1 TaxID=1541959 RepID=UPI0004F7B2DF|nr:Thioredoxin [Candidatus Izimaplasma bacterium HR1]